MIQCQTNEVIANHARSGRRVFLEAIPTVVERHIAAKPESQVWTGLNAVSLHGITQKSIEHRIACNCGAFAPYFLLFGLLVAYHYAKIDRASSKGPAVSALHTSNTLEV